MPSFKSAEKGVLNLAEAAVQAPEQIQERRAASEDLLAGIQADIGAPGTYDLPPASQPPAAAPPPPSTTSTTSPAASGLLTEGGHTFTTPQAVKKYKSLIKKGYTDAEAMSQMPQDLVQPDSTSIFTRKATGTGGAGISGATTGMTTLQVDPTKAKAQLESSSMFRTVSRMQAESEQLLARQGPLYDEMLQSTQLPIIESSAALARENTENIRQAMARGGSARRDAFEAVQTIRAQDSANMQKGQMLAQAHLQLDQWARQYAQSTVAFAQNWSQNVAGVRDNFNAAMDNAAALFENSALPFAFGAEQQVQKWREAQSAQSRGTVNRWIGGVLGLAEGVMIAYRGGDPSGANKSFTGISDASTGSLVGDVEAAGSAVAGGAQKAWNYITGSPSQSPSQSPTQQAGDYMEAVGSTLPNY